MQKIRRILSLASISLLFGCLVFGVSSCTRRVDPSSSTSTSEEVGEWVVTKEATCTEDGLETLVNPSNPSDAQTRVIPALGHDLVHHESKAPTCKEIGWEAYDTCSRCDYTTYVELSKTEHSFGSWVIDKEATCLEEGSKHSVCSICGETKNETIPALGHTHAEAVVENRVEPTCTVDGSYDSVVYCSVCNVEISRENIVIPAKGHTSSDWIIDVEPTCTTTGSKHKECTVCHEVLETEAIPATGHTHGNAVEENRVEATCTKDGSYDSVVYCSVCNTEISRDKIVIPSAGHDYDGQGVTYSWSEDLSECTASVTCKLCGNELIEIVATTNEITTAPDYNNTGVRTYKAQFENALFGIRTYEVVIDALAHEAKVSIDGAEAVAMESTAKGDEDTWKEQYKLTTSLTAGQELVFTYNGTVISSNIGPDSGDNNLKLEDNKLLVICSAENVEIYFKVYESGYSVWVTGYQHNIQVYVDGVETSSITDIEKDDNIAAFTINLRLGQVMTITNNGVTLKVGTGEITAYEAIITGTYTVYVNKYKQIWVTNPKSTTYSVTVNGVETDIVLIPDETNNAQFKLSLKAGDVVVVYGSGIELLGGSYERTEYKVTKDGEYTFYVNKKDKVYLSVIFYLKPNSNWLVDNARFAANLFGNGDTWVDLIKCGDGTYKLSLTLEQYNTYNGLIFCRMNPNTSTNNWGNKWNQTGDLVLSNSDSNLYTVAEGAWDKGEGTWSTKK